MALALALGVLIAQVSESGGFNVAGILGGIIGSSPVAAVLLWRLLIADRDVHRRDEKIEELHQQQLHLSERMAPLIHDATRTLEDVQEGMRATLDRHEVPDVSDVARRLEKALGDLNRQ
jgi:hypothetical protein